MASTTLAERLCHFLAEADQLDDTPPSWPFEVTEDHRAAYHEEDGIGVKLMPPPGVMQLEEGLHELVFSTADEVMEDIEAVDADQSPAWLSRILMTDGSVAVAYYHGHSETAWLHFGDEDEAGDFCATKHHMWR